MPHRSDFSLPLVLAHGALSSSSAWAIWATSDFLLAPLGFSLYLINGIMGLVAFGIEDSARVHRMHKVVLLSGLSLSLPLFSSQLYLDQHDVFPETHASRNIQSLIRNITNGLADFDGFTPSLTLLLLIHLAPLIAQITLVRHITPGPLHSVYFVSLVYVSWTRGYYYGLSTVVSLLIAMFIISPFGTVYSVPARVLFNFALSFSVYFLVQMFRGY